MVAFFKILTFYLKTKHFIQGRVVFPQPHPHPQPSFSVISNRTRTYTQQFFCRVAPTIPHTTTCNLCYFLNSNRKHSRFFHNLNSTRTCNFLYFFDRTYTCTCIQNCNPQYRTIRPNRIPTCLRVWLNGQDPEKQSSKIAIKSFLPNSNLKKGN